VAGDEPTGYGLAGFGDVEEPDVGFAIHDTGQAAAYTDGGPCAVTIAVTAGDLIVVGIGTLSTTITPAGISDEDGNTYVLRTGLAAASSAASLRLAYCLAASGTNATLTITATFDAGSTRQMIFAASFTPDGGDTVSLDTSANKESGWEASPWETGTFSTTGDDEVCVAFLDCGSSAFTFSNHEIPSGIATTEIESVAYGMTGWYRILGATVTDAVAEVDPSGSNRYNIEMLAFKSVAAGGVANPWYQYQQERLAAGM